MSARVSCGEKTAAGSTCGNPAMFRMECGAVVCRQHRRARHHRGKAFERLGEVEVEAIEVVAEEKVGRAKWRARGSTWHAFAGSRSLCGRFVVAGNPGPGIRRPARSARCSACDLAEVTVRKLKGSAARSRGRERRGREEEERRADGEAGARAPGSPREEDPREGGSGGGVAGGARGAR